jgi:hypothetical protein
MSMQAPLALPEDTFGIDRSVVGGVTVLDMHGSVHHDFSARKTANGVRTKKLVVTMRDVRRFASWGMSEWMDFTRLNAQRDVYLVECSTYAVSQLSLVTGLLGQCKLVSFYASYRCGSCSDELEALFVVPGQCDRIRELPNSTRVCPSCGGPARLEEYPASFFERIADRGEFDIDDEVLALLRARYSYDIAPDLTRFRAFRRVKGDYTYLRLSGSLSLLRPDAVAAVTRATTVVDLKNVIFDDPTAWRTYIGKVLPTAASLHLLDCPVGFLEYAVTPDDLREGVKIRTFAVMYDCLQCETSTPRMVDVADTLEDLVKSVLPSASCLACGSVMVALPTTAQIARLRSLPARHRDPAFDKFLAKVRTEPLERLENCLLLAETPKPATQAKASRVVPIALGLGAVLSAAVIATLVMFWNQQQQGERKNPQVAPTPPPLPTFTRPEWITIDAPATAYCHDLINRLMCVGVSSYRAAREEAVLEANEAALEELVNVVALRISDSFFSDHVLRSYSAARSKLLADLQANPDRKSDEHKKTIEQIRSARARAGALLRASGGAAAPVQRSDWYWEEYATEPGQPNETLVFARYDVSLDAMRSLVETYSRTKTVLGGVTVMTAFPALAWRYDPLDGGAVVTKVPKSAAEQGLAAGDIIVGLGDRPIGDADTLARALADLPRRTEVVLTLKRPNGDKSVTVTVK